MKPVLLIIDMLIDFLDSWPESDRAQLVDATQMLIHGFRAARRPIIWVRQEFEADLSDAFKEMRRKHLCITIKGTQGCKVIPELVPLSDDLTLLKSATARSSERDWMSCFRSTLPTHLC